MNIASKPKNETVKKVNRSNKAVVILSDSAELEPKQLPKKIRRRLK